MHEHFKKRRDGLLAVVHPTVEALVKASALRWTVENLGQSWPETSTWNQLLECHMDGTGSMGARELREHERALQGEYSHWLEEAKDLSGFVVEAGLPLTMASMELAFYQGLPNQQRK
jgi:hypothetical protein